MSNNSTKKEGLPLTTLYMCLVVAITIASITFVVLEWRENVNTQPEEKLKNETTQDQEVDQTVLDSYRGDLTPVVAYRPDHASPTTSGANGAQPVSHCLLTRVRHGEDGATKQLTEDNTFVIPLRLCKSFVSSIEKLLHMDMIRAEEILYMK